MWEPFTESARRSIVVAQQEAALLGRSDIAPDLLLIGIAGASDPEVSEILSRHGLTRDAIRDSIQPGERKSPAEEMTFTPHAKRVIDLAFETARQSGHTYIGVAHLLSGLLRDDDASSRDLFKAVSADRSQIQTEVMEVLKAAPSRHLATQLRAHPLNDAGEDDIIELLRAIFATARRKGWDVNALIKTALESDE
jgi:ATP-dependent Clp protease ATP-binding subunit ClpC